MFTFDFLVLKFFLNLKFLNLSQLWPLSGPPKVRVNAKSFHMWSGTILGFQKSHFWKISFFHSDLWNSWVRINKLSFSARAVSSLLHGEGAYIPWVKWRKNSQRAGSLMRRCTSAPSALAKAPHWHSPVGIVFVPLQAALNSILRRRNARWGAPVRHALPPFPISYYLARAWVIFYLAPCRHRWRLRGLSWRKISDKCTTIGYRMHTINLASLRSGTGVHKKVFVFSI